MNGVRRARKALGLTQEEVAARVGVRQSYISDLERGLLTNPSWEIVSVLSRVLQTSPENLMPPVKARRRAVRDKEQVA